MNKLKRIICFFRGHPCITTGRRGNILHEQKCSRCNGIYISSDAPEHGNSLIPYVKDVEQLFDRYNK